MSAVVDHPYYPLNASLPHFTPQSTSMTTILGVFFSAVFVILGASYSLASAKIANPLTRMVFLWFVSCGFIHGVVEGYFAYNHLSIAGQSTFLADLWKEYAKSDSRYMTRDPFVSIMESITAAMWGPGSFLAAYLILTNNPARHLLQFLISTGQLYGDVLYYLTTGMEGFLHTRPEPMYFWFYFVFMNAFWIVIPVVIMFTSGTEIIRGGFALERERSGKRGVTGKKQK
ncbi:hypothetical protein HK101_003758 [Irineochytrium annulatum]|nr:hypothetical protein HK101_003758 [Irineochytrium annulatum]